MKANRPLVRLAPALPALLLASCVTPAAPPPAPPPPAPRPVVAAPPPLPPAPLDWRDAPQTPGNWRWAITAGRSAASFVLADGTAAAMLVCDRAAGRVLLSRAGPGGTSAQAMTVTTTSQVRPLLSDPAISTDGWLTLPLRASDSLLDAMALSRGRFMLEAAGQVPLYLPAWAEISRVVEDCR